MYTIVRADGGLEERVRQVVAQRHRDGRQLPQYLLAGELVGQAPVYVDGFLVMGSRLVGDGELCVVAKARPGRPMVRDERRKGAGGGK